ANLRARAQGLHRGQRVRSGGDAGAPRHARSQAGPDLPGAQADRDRAREVVVSDAALSGALVLCLGAGAADLLALNLLVLPAARAPLPSRIVPEARARPSAPAVGVRELHPELAAGLRTAPSV